MPDIGAVILASGESTRFKGNKLLYPVAKANDCVKPMLAHTLSTLKGEEFSRRAVVTRNPAVALLADIYGYDCLLHSLPDVCDTIRLGVQSMHGMDACLFCVGDQPDISACTIRKLLQYHEKFPERIIRAAYGVREGNPVLFPHSFFTALAALPTGRGGGAIIAHHRDLVLTVQAGSEMELWDIDTREALERYEKQFRML